MDKILDAGHFLSNSFGGGPSSSSLGPELSACSKKASEVSRITHRGYLLKRSNQPYTERLNRDTVGEADDLPELALMPRIFSPGNCEDRLSSDTQKNTQPLHSIFVSHSRVEKQAHDQVDKNPVQQVLDALAVFFGFALGGKPCEADVVEDSIEEEVHREQRKVIPPTKKTSKPIKMSYQGPLEGNQDKTDSFHEARYLRHSKPTMKTLGPDDHGEVPLLSDLPPRDVVDPRDGHIWRAKYCVLEDGILYFYRSPTDGESAEAVRERSEDSSTQSPFIDNGSKIKSNISDLSKSPMTSHFYHRLGSGGSLSCRWEKRVVLDCVGSVRSVEHDYGPYSFELQGIDSGDDSRPLDTLVLRAQDDSSMTEWIFQFHRSLASFIRDIVDVIGSTGTYLDLDFPLGTKSRVLQTPSSYSDEKCQRLLPMNHRLANNAPGLNSLSHGHGRTTVRRRKENAGSRIISNSESVSNSSHVAAENGGATFSSKSPESLLKTNVFRTSPCDSPQDRFLQLPFEQSGLDASIMTETSTQFLKPKLSKSSNQKYIPPNIRKNLSSREYGHVGNDVPMESTGNMVVKSSKRYVPRSLLGLSSLHQNGALKSLEEREMAEQEKPSPRNSSTSNYAKSPSYLDLLNIVEGSDDLYQCGGCADPKLVNGSIMDSANIPRGASKVLKSRSEAFGCFGSKVMNQVTAEKKPIWETGAVSECGIRDSNEDAYLIVQDLREVSNSLAKKDEPIGEEIIFRHPMPLFAIFDGHCGNEAARFAAEKLIFFLQEQLRQHLADSKGIIQTKQQSILYRQSIESALCDALKKLDDDFCRICQEGGRDWESGTTAIVAMIVDQCLIIANLGDCRGIVCRSVSGDFPLTTEGWQEFEKETGHSTVTSGVTRDKERRYCVWQEVANVHKPSDEKEKARIERANGWVTNETEIPIGQLRRMDFLDEDVVGILRRCFSDRYENSGSTIKECRAAPQRILQISRVCGELSVSRALGDRDFKAAFHAKSDLTFEDQNEPALWESPLLLAYPNEHSRSFLGNLVDNSPDFQQIQMGEEGCSEEFMLLASDGLWDVLDVDDAARVTRDLLFRRQWTAKRTAARLAELAVHLGSSDNITVIVVRFIDGH